MSKRLLYLICVVFVSVLALANSVFAQPETWPSAWWSGFGDGSSWDDVDNWYSADCYWDDVNYPIVPARIWERTPNSVPGIGTVVFIGQGVPRQDYPEDLNSLGVIGFPVIADGTDAVCYQIFVSTGPNDTKGPGRLDMTGGTLTSRVNSWNWICMEIGSVHDGNGVVNLSGGDILLDNYDGAGGMLIVGGFNYYDYSNGGGGGTLNMTGGTLSCYHMSCPDDTAPVEDGLRPVGLINLHGGTFYTTADEPWNEFWMGLPGLYPDSRIDVTDGRAVTKSHDEMELTAINEWIDEGKITAFGGIAPRAELYVNYDSVDGETTLHAISTELGQAWNPSPQPGTKIDYRPVLSWTAGDYASQHDVYFGTDETAVENATTSSPEYKPPRLALGITSYDPGLLELNAHYYWRIDEVNATGVPEWPGLVWDFETDNYLAVDHFESYADRYEFEDVWYDWNENDTRAQIYLETDVNFIRNGSASMRYVYDSAYLYLGSCVGSVADTDTTRLGISSNWSESGIKALVLYFYGDPGNSATAGDQMWLQLEDTSANSGTVLYDGDIGNLALPAWSEWNIDLADANFSGVDMANIDKIHIGFGGASIGGDCTSGGTGTLYFDDIDLYPSRCVPSEGPLVDKTDDCVVDYEELELLANDWLTSGYDVAASPPPTEPIARYTFDTEGGSGTTAINTGSLGSAANGTLSSGPPPTAAVSFVSPGAAHPDACDYDPNYATEFLGGAEGAIVINSDFNSIIPGGLTTNTMTLTCWVKRDGDQEGFTGLVFSTENVQGDWAASDVHAGLSFQDDLDWGSGTDRLNHFTYHWDYDSLGNEVGWMWRSPLPVVPDGEWTFGAIAVAPTEATLYMVSDGVMYSATNYHEHVPTTFSDPFNLGRDERGAWGGARTLNGQLDDVRIYDYTLTDTEVLYVAQEGGSTHVAVVSDVDFDGSDKIDFVDYGYIADQWLVEQLWP